MPEHIGMKCANGASHPGAGFPEVELSHTARLHARFMLFAFVQHSTALRGTSGLFLSYGLKILGIQMATLQGVLHLWIPSPRKAVGQASCPSSRRCLGLHFACSAVQPSLWGKWENLKKREREKDQKDTKK